MIEELKKLYDGSTDEEKNIFAEVVNLCIKYPELSAEELVGKIKNEKLEKESPVGTSGVVKKSRSKEEYEQLGIMNLGEIKESNIVSPFDITGNKELSNHYYPLKLASSYISDFRIAKSVDNTISIGPGEFKLCMAVEYIKLPSNIIAYLYSNPFYSEQGLVGIFSPIDCNFDGRIKLPFYNIKKDSEIKLLVNKPICYIQFVRVSP